MAARLNPQQDARTRSAIKTSQIINRLNAFIFEENDRKTGQPIEIDPVRMKAIEILLRKSLPDLSTVTLQGDDNKPLAFTSISLAPLVADAADD